MGKYYYAVRGFLWNLVNAQTAARDLDILTGKYVSLAESHAKLWERSQLQFDAIIDYQQLDAMNQRRIQELRAAVHVLRAKAK